MLIYFLMRLRPVVHGHHMNWIITCKQKKKAKTKIKKHSAVINNFYFFVLDYLGSWLNLMIVSMFVLESRQVRVIQNHKPQTQRLSINAKLDTLSLKFPVYWVKIFQNVTENLLSQNYINHLHLYHAQSSVQKFQRLLLRRTSILFVK